MILIVGNNPDDTLYFETRMNSIRKETIFDKYELSIGKIANQEVILLNDVHTNVLSSMLVSYIIQKYYVLFVIKIGKFSTISKALKNGDVIISKKIVAGDIDVCDIQGVQFGQVPGFAQSFNINSDLVQLIKSSFTKTTFVQTFDVNILSTNSHFYQKSQLDYLIHDDTIFQESIEDYVFDSESYGIGLACSLHNIPFIVVGAVFSHVGESFSANTYVKVLKQYGNVGKAIANVIGEIGSNEVLRGRNGYEL